MRNVLFCFFMLLINYTAYSQAVRGVVYDKTTGEKIKGADVFFDNTSISAVTDTNGNFEISLPNQNKYKLIVSALGYEYLVIESPSTSHKYSIHLVPEENVLNEIVIQANVFTRKEMLEAFRFFFLGHSSNAKKAKIINEDDIHLYYDTVTNTLNAFSDKPIVVYNHSLGYQIQFYLQSFQVQYRYKTLNSSQYSISLYLGYSQFKDIDKVSNRQLKNREIIAQNNSVHFFRELLKNNLSDDNYILSVSGFKVDPAEYFDIQKEGNEYMVCLLKTPSVKKPVLKKVSSSKDITLSMNSREYREEEVFMNTFNMKTKEQSLFHFNSKCVRFDLFGNLINAEQINFGGYYGNLRIADMLPLDYYEETVERKLKDNTISIPDNYTYDEFKKEAVAFYTSNGHVEYIKSKKRFEDLLTTTYNMNKHEPFDIWIVSNLKSTKFTSVENALDLHSNFLLTYKIIRDQLREIQEKEKYFANIYGEDAFNKMYANSVLKGVIEKINEKLNNNIDK